VKVARRRLSRIDGGLHYLQRRGVARGVFGTSSAWAWVALGAFAVRRFRRAVGSEPVLVYRGELGAGHTLQIEHLAETYAGRRVRRRRR
jgi:hypothetical protein